MNVKQKSLRLRLQRQLQQLLQKRIKGLIVAIRYRSKGLGLVDTQGLSCNDRREFNSLGECYGSYGSD